jgi:hypothetical protein
MPKVMISGVVMEVFEKEAVGRDEKIKLMSENKAIPMRKCARIFQKGEKNMVEVKDINGQCVEGETVELFCSVIAWATDRGVPGLSFTCLEG